MIECVIALASGVTAPKEDPERVTVSLEVKDDGEQPVSGPDQAVIHLRIV